MHIVEMTVANTYAKVTANRANCARILQNDDYKQLVGLVVFILLTSQLQIPKRLKRVISAVLSKHMYVQNISKCTGPRTEGKKVRWPH